MRCASLAPLSVGTVRHATRDAELVVKASFHVDASGLGHLAAQAEPIDVGLGDRIALPAASVSPGTAVPLVSHLRGNPQALAGWPPSIVVPERVPRVWLRDAGQTRALIVSCVGAWLDVPQARLHLLWQGAFPTLPSVQAYVVCGLDVAEPPSHDVLMRPSTARWGAVIDVRPEVFAAAVAQHDIGADPTANVRAEDLLTQLASPDAALSDSGDDDETLEQTLDPDVDRSSAVLPFQGGAGVAPLLPSFGEPLDVDVREVPTPRARAGRIRAQTLPLAATATSLAAAGRLPFEHGERGREAVEDALAEETIGLSMPVFAKPALPFARNGKPAVPPPPTPAVEDALAEETIGLSMSVIAKPALPFASPSSPVPAPPSVRPANSTRAPLVEPAWAPSSSASPAPVSEALSVPEAPAPALDTPRPSRVAAFATPPPAEAHVPPPPLPRRPRLAIEQMAEVKAAMLDGAPLAGVLASLDIEESVWLFNERLLAIELSREEAQGGHELASALEKAIAAARRTAQDAARAGEGRPDEHELELYLSIRAEIEEESPREVLEELGVSRDDYVHMRRKWTRRSINDRALARDIRDRLAKKRRELRQV